MLDQYERDLAAGWNAANFSRAAKLPSLERVLRGVRSSRAGAGKPTANAEARAVMLDLAARQGSTK